MTPFLDLFGFLSVLLRGLTLSSQTLLIGGAVFHFVLSPVAVADNVARRCRRLLTVAAFALALSQLSYVAADSAILMATTGLGLAEVAEANFFLAGCAGAILALAVALLQRLHSRLPRIAALVLSVGIIGASIATSHAAARVEGRGLLSLLTALHQAATAAWIGGLPYLLIVLSRLEKTDSVSAVCRRFSRLAQVCVAILFAAGAGLSLTYIDSPGAIYATSYGAMVASKIALFGLLLVLGAFNFFTVRREPAGGSSGFIRLRRLVEAEIGIGFTVILAAASLTSQPPAVDLVEGRMSLAEVVGRMAPQWPRLRPPAPNELYPQRLLNPDISNAPDLQSFVPGQLSYPITPEEIALSEFNHNWSGMVVALAGVLALAARAGVSSARTWPFAFLGLAAFLFFMADADYWPLGPLNFWKGFTVSEVLQHRLVVPLIVAFAWFEWRVQTGRANSPRAALVFPFVCFAGGALLLTHSHSLNNNNEELLAELSHIPIALLGVTAGWSRWLELRLPSGPQRILSWIWPICFVLIGLLLLTYRES